MSINLSERDLEAALSYLDELKDTENKIRELLGGDKGQTLNRRKIKG